MGDCVKFAVIGDCHYSGEGNYSTRDCLGAKDKVVGIIESLNSRNLDFVFSLGDLGDGRSESEVPDMLEAFGGCRHPIKYAIGNHDLCRRGEREHAQTVGMPAPMYDFTVKNYRFIVINAFEISRFSRDEEEKKSYWDFRKNNPDVPVQEWPGLLRDTSWMMLENILRDAECRAENVIVFSHVPALPDACYRESYETEPHAVLVEHERMLELLGRYPNVRSYIAGHYHQGGLAIRDGIMHKTVRSVCDFKEATYCVITADDEKIKIRGVGAETNFVHFY